MDEGSTYLGGELADVRRETREQALNRQRNRAMAYTLLVAIASAAGAIATARAVFTRRSQKPTNTAPASDPGGTVAGPRDTELGRRVAQLHRDAPRPI